jgi:hypothetical protein
VQGINLAIRILGRVDQEQDLIIRLRFCLDTFDDGGEEGVPDVRHH